MKTVCSLLTVYQIHIKRLTTTNKDYFMKQDTIPKDVTILIMEIAKEAVCTVSIYNYSIIMIPICHDYYLRIELCSEDQKQHIFCL